MQRNDRAFLDRPAARLLAALVIVLCGGLLGYIHRDDLGIDDHAAGSLPAEGPAADPAVPCIERRFAEIDAMIEEGVVDDDQALLFKQRAEAMCRATAGDGGASPPLPAE